MNAPPIYPARAWPASLQLQLAERGGRTVLTHNRHRGPLRVLKPYYPESCGRAHIYLLHPPGGLVVGDALTLDLTQGDNARTLYTTPSAGKVYAAPPGPTEQWQQINLYANGGSLEWLPQETIVFDGARAQLHLSLECTSTTQFVLWDIIVLGRSAGDAPFLTGYCHQSLSLRLDGRLHWLERNRFEAGSPMLSAKWGLQGASVTGTLAAHPPGGADRALVERARAEFDQPELALTCKGPLLLARYLGNSSEQCRHLFEHLWRWLRNAAGEAPVRPRIWNT